MSNMGKKFKNFDIFRKYVDKTQKFRHIKKIKIPIPPLEKQK